MERSTERKESEQQQKNSGKQLNTNFLIYSHKTMEEINEETKEVTIEETKGETSDQTKVQTKKKAHKCEVCELSFNRRDHLVSFQF